MRILAAILLFLLTVPAPGAAVVFPASPLIANQTVYSSSNSIPGQWDSLSGLTEVKCLSATEQNAFDYSAVAYLAITDDFSSSSALCNGQLSLGPTAFVPVGHDGNFTSRSGFQLTGVTTRAGRAPPAQS